MIDEHEVDMGGITLAWIDVCCPGEDEHPWFIGSADLPRWLAHFTPESVLRTFLAHGRASSDETETLLNPENVREGAAGEPGPAAGWCEPGPNRSPDEAPA